MFNTEKLFHHIFKFTNKTKFLIAYSGGMDSHVLLHSMNDLRQQNPLLKIRAVHIHHGLNANADSWVTHCSAICEQLNIELIVKYVVLPCYTRRDKGIQFAGRNASTSMFTHEDCERRSQQRLNSKDEGYKHSIEALARELRYQEFIKIINTDECLLTAHHADDQAETVLLQLFRGGGPKGLAAMPKHKNFAQGIFLRPLLEFSRKDLHDYARKNQLHWIEDDSNENIGHDRNFVRHKLMPIITERWPSILKTLARSAEHCATANDLLTVLAQQDYLSAQGSASNTLSVKQLLTFNSARCNNLIRYWLQKLNLPIPSSIKLQHILSNVLSCRIDAKPKIHWRGAEIRRYRDDLYAMQPLSIIQTDVIIPWNPKTNLELPNNLGILTPQLLKNHSINIDHDSKDITVRFRHAGDKCKVKNRARTHSLKKLFQEQNIPPWQRNRVPLIFQGEELIGIIPHL